MWCRVKQVAPSLLAAEHNTCQSTSDNNISQSIDHFAATVNLPTGRNMKLFHSRSRLLFRIFFSHKALSRTPPWSATLTWWWGLCSENAKDL